jgi:hypothetical protein
MKGSIKHGNNIHHEHSNGIGKRRIMELGEMVFEGI